MTRQYKLYPVICFGAEWLEVHIKGGRVGFIEPTLPGYRCRDNMFAIIPSARAETKHQAAMLFVNKEV